MTIKRINRLAVVLTVTIYGLVFTDYAEALSEAMRQEPVEALAAQTSTAQTSAGVTVR